MASKRIEMNRGPQAGHVLLWGFKGRGNHNRIENKAAVKIPIYSGYDNVVKFGISSSNNCDIILIYDEVETVLAVFKGRDNEYCLTIPESMTRDRQELIIVIKTPLNQEPIVKQYGRIENLVLNYIEIEADKSKDDDIKVKGRIETESPILVWSDFVVESFKTLRSPFRKKIDINRFKTPDYNLYWGDLHIHSSYSRCGGNNGALEENYEYGRDIEKLDFMSITDHDYLDGEDWQKYCEIANGYNQPGKFITFIGKEWTSFEYGHKNIYYKGDRGQNINCWHSESDTPQKLYKKLKSIGQEVLLIPHHPSTVQHITNWDYYDEELEKLVEVYSGWGNSEYYGAPLQETESTVPGCFVQDALIKGYKLGMIGGGDAHIRMAGSTGIMGVYAKELTRDNLWDAMSNRRVYATTGARMKLDFNINGFFMGSIIKVNQYTIDSLYPLSISIAVKGTVPLQKVELLENNCVIKTQNKWIDKDGSIFFNVTLENLSVNVSNSSRYYYIRATQKDGHMAWSSPIWVDFEMNEGDLEEV
jgi:hypothetical protein